MGEIDVKYFSTMLNKVHDVKFKSIVVSLFGNFFWTEIFLSILSAFLFILFEKIIILLF